VRCADIVRSQHTPFRIVPARGQVTEDGSKISGGNKARDVLEKTPPGSNLPNDPECLGPHVTLVIGGKSLAGNAEGLARSREPRSDAIHNATKRGSVEAPYISEYRGIVVDAVGNPLSDNLLAVFVIFNVSNYAMSQQYRGKHPAPGPCE